MGLPDAVGVLGGAFDDPDRFDRSGPLVYTGPPMIGRATADRPPSRIC